MVQFCSPVFGESSSYSCAACGITKVSFSMKRTGLSFKGSRGGLGIRLRVEKDNQIESYNSQASKLSSIVSIDFKHTSDSKCCKVRRFFLNFVVLFCT